MVLGAALDSFAFFFCQKSILPTDSITIVDVRVWRGFSAVLTITKFGGVPIIQGAHAVFRLGKPSFKKENLSFTAIDGDIR